MQARELAMYGEDCKCPHNPNKRDSDLQAVTRKLERKSGRHLCPKSRHPRSAARMILSLEMRP